MISNNKTFTKIIEKQLLNLVSNFPFIEEAVIVSSDGYVVANSKTNNKCIEKVSTMGSSMISLADTMTAELKMGRCVNLITENESGLVVIIHINSDLKIITVTRKVSQLGMLLTSTKKYAAKIRESIN
ncbi:MAG: roadblock/LC7 domain-containing protein [Kangiellaceae bacterium]|nr:roadblock/LC7 domain-containing protein [Kangiellaceae bacterium]